MNTAIHYYMAGLGQSDQQDQQQTNQQVKTVAQGASTAAIQIINGNYVGGIGTALMTAAPFTGIAAPFLIVAGAAAEVMGAIGIGKGCGQTCIAATDFANQAENILRQNLNTYMAQSPRYQSAQTAALNIFDQVWAALISVQACGNPALGDAGKRCISDRQRGSCKYRGADGQCWNWFVGYRDPIANDSSVIPDPVSASILGSTASSALTSAGIDPTMLLIVGGVGLALVLIGSSS